MKCYIFGILLTFGALSCQKKPAISAAADPLSSMSPPPMGASLYNDELKRELSTLDELLDKRLSLQRVMAVKKAFISGRTGDKLNGFENDALASLYMRLPELVHRNEDFSPGDKLWFKAKLFFLNRRFVESSMILTEILKADPNFHQARNWRACCIFFLGNLDLALSELLLITKQTPKNSNNHLEALYLTGAIVYEANDLEERRINQGLKAWQAYLRLVQNDDAIYSEVKNGIAELSLRQAQGKNSLVALDPFSPNKKYGAAKNRALQAFIDGELVQALELCQKAQKAAYDRDIAIIEARLFLKTGRLMESVALFEQIVAKNPKYAPAFHYQGMAYMLKGEAPKAVSAWQKTLALDSVYGNNHNLKQRIEVAQKMTSDPVKIELH
jgi:tetratricopeptide (TPR) repeat protein